jgi:hypothetical protein
METPQKPEPFEISYTSLVNLNVKLLDFSPEWDYTTGGTKVLVCFTPGLDILNKPEI